MMEFLGIKDKFKLSARKNNPFEETKKGEKSGLGIMNNPQDQVDTLDTQEDNSNM